MENIQTCIQLCAALISAGKHNITDICIYTDTDFIRIYFNDLWNKFTSEKYTIKLNFYNYFLAMLQNISYSECCYKLAFAISNSLSLYSNILTFNAQTYLVKFLPQNRLPSIRIHWKKNTNKRDILCRESHSCKTQKSLTNCNYIY